MNKIQAVVAVAFVALSTASYAQDSAEVARQHRMDAAYVAHRDGPANTVREDAHRAGHAIHNGARATGHAIHNGVRATGHAIHKGARATGHAIHRGVDKLTGK
jgi:Ni/Co efflux regulator RcnB